MKTLILAALCTFSLFIITGTTLTDKGTDTITICLDTTCNLSYTWTARLYDNSNTNIRTCIISSASDPACCTVDSVP